LEQVVERERVQKTELQTEIDSLSSEITKQRDYIKKLQTDIKQNDSQIIQLKGDVLILQQREEKALD